MSLENEIADLKKKEGILGKQLMERTAIIKEKYEKQEPFTLLGLYCYVTMASGKQMSGEKATIEHNKAANRKYLTF